MSLNLQKNYYGKQHNQKVRRARVEVDQAVSVHAQRGN
jgi:hypothetical protein